MTRIIAGAARGVTLSVPPTGTRPTSDRVREAILGSLDSADAIDDARVLDLYAGSGALALEAASRGAAHVALVERAPKAAAICEANLQAVRKATGVTGSVHKTAALSFLANTGEMFDLVFIDPPYDLSADDLDEVLIALRPTLNEHAVVVVERSKRSAEPDWEAAGLTSFKDRKYGDTMIWYAELD